MYLNFNSSDCTARARLGLEKVGASWRLLSVGHCGQSGCFRSPSGWRILIRQR